MATTPKALARAFAPPAEAAIVMSEGRVDNGATLVVYCECQPAIGGMVRGAATWSGVGQPDDATMAELRKQAYADLLVNARKYRIRHGNTK